MFVVVILNLISGLFSVSCLMIMIVIAVIMIFGWCYCHFHILFIVVGGAVIVGV